MLLTADLDFNYPDNLVATEALPRGKSRIWHISRDSNKFEEIGWERFLAHFKKGDTLVLNDSRVLWARLKIKKISGAAAEVFFLKTLDGNPNRWEVLSRGLNLKLGGEIDLPGDVKARVLVSGRVSQIEITSKRFGPEDLKNYFTAWGDVPLPPYIMSLRPGKESLISDKERYQTVWAQNWGSVAAPTAGLHFTEEHLAKLRQSGVKVVFVTLHVGAGTFMPVDTEKLDDFNIHSEFAVVGDQACAAILETQAAGKRVWACGTTALRAVESAIWATGQARTNLPLIRPFAGETNLFIKPGYKFLAVDGLLTNFHQPRSSLLALVAAFATRMPPVGTQQERAAVEKILEAYRQAIQKKFRLFSYGDLTVIS
jgi:S-adenosylmethionine:tRNA ribosyltransferase-isomerase